MTKMKRKYITANYSDNIFIYSGISSRQVSSTRRCREYLIWHRAVRTKRIYRTFACLTKYQSNALNKAKVESLYEGVSVEWWHASDYGYFSVYKLQFMV